MEQIFEAIHSTYRFYYKENHKFGISKSCPSSNLWKKYAEINKKLSIDFLAKKLTSSKIYSSIDFFCHFLVHVGSQFISF